MKTVKPVEQATDSQLRQLTRPYVRHPDDCDMIESLLPMLTTERAHLINLLKTNHVFQFAIHIQQGFQQ